MSRIQSGLLQLNKENQKQSDKPIEDVTRIYYANDFNGYLGAYLDLIDKKTYSYKRDEKFRIYCDGYFLFFPASYEGFFGSLRKMYPDSRESICTVENTLAEIGQEWFEFVISGFEMKKMIFLRKAAQHSKWDYQEYLEHTITDKRIINIMMCLQPHGGRVSLNVMAGYLYKQFFDINSSPELWETIYSKTGSFVEHPDFKCEDHIEDSSAFQNDYAYASALLENSEDKDAIVTFGVLEDLHFIHWPLKHQCDSTHYKLDVAIPNHREVDLEIILNKIPRVIETSQCITTAYPKDYETVYGFTSGTGLRWAYSKEKSIKLYSRLCDTHDYSYWGFAFMSAVLQYTFDRGRKNT